jgi:hypothetical protein
MVLLAQMGNGAGQGSKNLTLVQTQSVPEKTPFLR